MKTYASTADYYYLAMKRNEGQRHPTAWVYPEDMMLSKISQSQNPHIYGSTYMICPEHANIWGWKVGE